VQGQPKVGCGSGVGGAVQDYGLSGGYTFTFRGMATQCPPTASPVEKMK